MKLVLQKLYEIFQKFHLQNRIIVKNIIRRISIETRYFEFWFYLNWGGKKVTIYFPIFYLVNNSEKKNSFICILPDYIAHEYIQWEQ